MIRGQTASQTRAAFLATESSNYQKVGLNRHDKNCFECGKPGHLRASCPELFGGGHGRGQDW
jgi:hypothetical protein